MGTCFNPLNKLWFPSLFAGFSSDQDREIQREAVPKSANYLWVDRCGDNQDSEVLRLLTMHVAEGRVKHLRKNGRSPAAPKVHYLCLSMCLRRKRSSI